MGHVGRNQLSSGKATNYQMASAMPDPCDAENLQGSKRRPEPAEIVFFGNFFKEQFSIISPKKEQCYQHNMLLLLA